MKLNEKLKKLIFTKPQKIDWSTFFQSFYNRVAGAPASEGFEGKTFFILQSIFIRNIKTVCITDSPLTEINVSEILKSEY